MLIKQKERFYGKDVIKVSVKNVAQEMSLIRLRININGRRLTYYLPTEYKIRPKHFDIVPGRAIEDSKLNPDLKGNPQLKLILRNINTEIEKSINALIVILENFKLGDIQPSVEIVRDALRAELNRSVINVKRAFADFPEFMSYYISLCKDGTILNGKGVHLVPGTVRNYISTQSVIKKYCAIRKIKLKMDDVGVDFYNDFIKYLNDATHARGR